jgi:transposase
MTQATTQDIDTMVELYRSGLTVRQVAAQTGFSRSTVGKHLAARDVDTTRQLLLRPEQIEQASELYYEGARLEDLAQWFGVSDTTIRTHLLRAGVKMRLGGRSNPTIPVSQPRLLPIDVQRC